MNFQYETERLILKILPESAASDVLFFQLKNQEHFEEFDGQPQKNFYTKQYQKNLLFWSYNMAVRQKAVRFWLFEKENPFEIIGTVSIQRIERGIFQSCTLGYKLDKDHLHQGYMTEALEKVISIVFSELSLHRIEAFVHPQNTASIRILNHLNFKEEGIAYESVFAKGQWQDYLRFALISGPECQPKD